MSSTHLEEAEKLLANMTPGEKALLLQRVARDVGDALPGIDASPAVCGGAAVVARTRIPVWVLEQARRQGASESDLLQSYPGLQAEDLANAWAYVRARNDEIAAEIVANEAA